jgi:hypothetical protein
MNFSEAAVISVKSFLSGLMSMDPTLQLIGGFLIFMVVCFAYVSK